VRAGAVRVGRNGVGADGLLWIAGDAAIATSRSCGYVGNMHFSKNEWIALLIGIIPAASGMMADNVLVFTLGWSLVWLILCYIIYNQKHVKAAIRILWCIAVVVLGGCFIYILREAKIERDSHEIFGTLYPSNMDTSGLASCPDTGIAIYIGANIDCVTQFPLPLLSIDDDPIIVLDKTSGGQIVITYLLLNDANDYNLASINGDVYWTNPNVRKEISHDRDHLVVYDTSGQRALVVEFMNPNHLSLAGEFYHHKFHVSITLQSIVAHLPDGHDTSLRDDRFFNHQIRVSKDGFLMFTSAPKATSLFIHP
jgi:hypothetical protein